MIYEEKCIYMGSKVVIFDKFNFNTLKLIGCDSCLVNYLMGYAFGITHL